MDPLGGGKDAKRIGLVGMDPMPMGDDGGGSANIGPPNLEALGSAISQMRQARRNDIHVKLPQCCNPVCHWCGTTGTAQQVSQDEQKNVHSGGRAGESGINTLTQSMTEYK